MLLEHVQPQGTHGTDSEDFSSESNDRKPDQRKGIDDGELVLTLQGFIDNGTKESMEIGENMKQKIFERSSIQS